MTEKNKKSLLVFAVTVYSIIIAFWMLSKGPLDNHECLVSVTAKEMLANDNWVIPTFNGEVRLQKTPLSYWLVASVAKITGSVNEFSARLPSASLAVLSAAAILYFTAQWLKFPIAVLSAAVWISTLAFIRYSHNGRPEMTLCTFVMISMLSFYSAIKTQSRRRQISYMLIFWLSFSLAMLAKGPAPLVLIAPPIFFYFAIFRQWNKLKLTLPIIGTILFLLIVLPWPIMVAAKVPDGWAFWKREFIDRFMGDYASGHKPFWYYLPIMFLFTAPFSAFVPHAIAAPFCHVWERKRPVMWYLWLWFVLQILIMSISGGKRQHYIFPAMPAFSILAAICLYDMIFEQKAFKLKQVRNFFICHIIVIAAAAIGLLYWAFTREKLFLLPSIYITMMLLLALGIVIILSLQNKKIAAIVLFFIGYCATLMTVYVYLICPMDYNIPSRIFSTQIGRLVPADKPLIAYNNVSARTIQYVGRIIPEITDYADVYRRYENGQWIIATGSNYKDLIADGRFSTVYYEETAERSGSNDVEGALFHKSGSVKAQETSEIPSPAQ
jgi:4-amino-4-deoxy-L-arabinose transferase-like glycosyltransferase